VRWLREHRGWVLIVALFVASQYMVAARLQVVGVVLWLTALTLLLRKLDHRTRRSGTEGIAHE
jgi:hypothetical protein